ncbi:MAG: hypothetical protein JRH20_28620 [Deltaproteobacteria bacterium]|nr:hypothetical protein [Deltaproteobacteria bacterium]
MVDGETSSPCKNLPLNSDNTALGPPLVLPVPGISPVVAFDEPSGIVVWRAPAENGLADILAMRLDAAGLLIDTTALIVATGVSSDSGLHSTSNHSNHFTAVAANNSTFLIAWAAGEEFYSALYGRTISAEGELGNVFVIQEMTSATNIITYKSKATQPRVAAVGDHFVTLWNYSSATKNSQTVTRAQRYDLTGAAIGDQLQVAVG